MKLKNKIIAMTGGTFLLCMLIFTLLVNMNIKRMMTDQIKSGQLGLVTQTSETFNQWVAVRKSMLLATAEEISKLDLDAHKETLQILTATSSGGDFVEAYIGYDHNGSFLDSSGWIPPKDYDPRIRPWYKAASDKGQAILTKPYVDANTGKMVISFAAPVFKNGKKIGAVSADIFLTFIVDTVLNTKVSSKGYAVLTHHDGTVIVHPDKELVNKPLPSRLATAFSGITNKNSGVMNVAIDDTDNMLAFSEVKESGWKLLVISPDSEIYAPVWNLIYLMSGLAILFVAVSVVVAYFIGRSIARPISQTVSMIEELEQGKLSTRLDLTRHDEIGILAKTMNDFADNLQAEMVDNLQRLADGNLDFEVIPRSKDDQIRGALNKLGSDLRKIVIEIQAAGDQIDIASSQVSDSSQTLSQGTTESAASLEEISASINEVASQANNSAQNATQARNLAQEATTAAAEGNDKMVSMIGAMADIDEASQSIGKIIKVIDEIAFQTNLLALNAAVEAARAGQHGKGFAVVAEEVRNLAARSAKAARETADLITNSVEKTTTGTQIAEQTSGALEKIVEIISKVTDIVGEIATSNSEQAQGISQINLGLSQIDQGVQQNTATAEESAAAAEELSAQSAHLKQMLSHFSMVQGTAPAPVKKRQPKQLTGGWPQ